MAEAAPAASTAKAEQARGVASCSARWYQFVFFFCKLVGRCWKSVFSLGNGLRHLFMVFVLVLGGFFPQIWYILQQHYLILLFLGPLRLQENNGLVKVTAAKKCGTTKKVVIPKNHKQNIKQPLIDVFSRDTWPILSKHEEATKPPVLKSERESTIPFFDQTAEPPAVTLYSVWFKDLDGIVSQIYSPYWQYQISRFANPKQQSITLRCFGNSFS